MQDKLGIPPTAFTSLRGGRILPKFWMKISREVLLGKPEPQLSPIEKLKLKMASANQKSEPPVNITEPVIDNKPLNIEHQGSLGSDIPETIQDTNVIEIPSQTLKELVSQELTDESEIKSKVIESVDESETPLMPDVIEDAIDIPVIPETFDKNNEQVDGYISLQELENTVPLTEIVDNAPTTDTGLTHPSTTLKKVSTTEKTKKSWKLPSTKTIIITIVGVIVVSLIGFFTYKLIVNADSQTEKKPAVVKLEDKKAVQAISTKVVETQSTNQAETSESSATEPATGQDIGGGYRLVITKYNENTSSEYSEYSIIKPEKPQEPVLDDKAKSLQEEFESTMPVINTTIKVKDPSKISMETYKVGEDYYTILLNDSNPFGYIQSVNDIHTNTVTTYYIKEVHAE